MTVQEENEVLKELVAILAWHANLEGTIGEYVPAAKSNLKMRKKGELPPYHLDLNLSDLPKRNHE